MSKIKIISNQRMKMGRERMIKKKVDKKMKTRPLIMPEEKLFPILINGFH